MVRCDRYTFKLAQERGCIYAACVDGIGTKTLTPIIRFYTSSSDPLDISLESYFYRHHDAILSMLRFDFAVGRSSF